VTPLLVREGANAIFDGTDASHVEIAAPGGGRRTNRRWNVDEEIGGVDTERRLHWGKSLRSR